VKSDGPVFGEARQIQISGAGVLDAPLSRGLTRGNFVRIRLDSGDFQDQIGQLFGRVEPSDGAGSRRHRGQPGGLGSHP
jgi:hypothetical protein